MTGVLDPEEERLAEMRRRALAGQRRHAVSLIQVLIVLAVVAYLGVTMAPKLLQVVGFVRSTTANRTAAEIQSAMQRYAIEHGDFPSVPTYSELAYALRPYAALPRDPDLEGWHFISYTYRPGDYTLLLAVGSGNNPETLVIRPGAITRP